MDEIIVKFSFVLSVIYMLTSYFTGISYEAFLTRGVIVFLATVFILILTHILIVRYLIGAKIEVLQEDFVNTFNIIKSKREERAKEQQNIDEDKE